MTRPTALLPLGLKNQDPAAREAVHGASLPSFEEVVLVHLDAAYTLARYLTRRSDIAEDIVQEAVLRAFVSFDKQRGESARSWLLAIVRNCFLTWYARDRKHSATSGIDNLFQLNVKPALEPSDAETPESVLLEHEECDAVRAVLEQMPEHFREILVLRDIQDHSYREIAVILGVPIGTVMSRLARARKLFTEAWRLSNDTASETQRDMVALLINGLENSAASLIRSAWRLTPVLEKIR